MKWLLIVIAARVHSAMRRSDTAKPPSVKQRTNRRLVVRLAGCESNSQAPSTQRRAADRERWRDITAAVERYPHGGGY
jgi:hypothetical protein